MQCKVTSSMSLWRLTWNDVQAAVFVLVGLLESGTRRAGGLGFQGL